MSDSVLTKAVAEACPQGPHQTVTGCVLCRLEDAREDAAFTHMALRQETDAYRKFQDAARKLDLFMGDLTAEQCAALPAGMAEAWSEFEDAIPCRDCGAAPCGCPNV